MKKQELRIGNLIEVNGVIQEVCVIPLPENCTIENTKPIPLTEDWLLNLGFVNNCLIIKGILFEVGHVGSDFVNNEMTLRINQFISLKIQHVHQLQNLYFAITNTELS